MVVCPAHPAFPPDDLDLLCGLDGHKQTKDKENQFEFNGHRTLNSGTNLGLSSVHGALTYAHFWLWQILLAGDN